MILKKMALVLAVVGFGAVSAGYVEDKRIQIQTHFAFIDSRGDLDQDAKTRGKAKYAEAQYIANKKFKDAVDGGYFAARYGGEEPGTIVLEQHTSAEYQAVMDYSLNRFLDIVGVDASAYPDRPAEYWFEASRW